MTILSMVLFSLFGKYKMVTLQQNKVENSLFPLSSFLHSSFFFSPFFFLPHHSEFHGLSDGILVGALRVLERDGRAELFSGSSDDSLGVKFFPSE